MTGFIDDDVLLNKQEPGYRPLKPPVITHSKGLAKDHTIEELCEALNEHFNKCEEATKLSMANTVEAQRLTHMAEGLRDRTAQLLGSKES